jgi:predicted MFS family arabinose efflux permease
MTSSSLVSPDVEVAKRAVAAVFLGSGVAFATWASRIPQVRDNLDLTPAVLGIVLLGIAAGSLIALPTAGWVVHRLGPTRTIVVMSLIFCVGLVVTAIGASTSVVVVLIGLFIMGYGNGNWDVAMNVEGAAVEQRLKRPVMPRFHAGFSIGAVIGAAIGAGMNFLNVPVTAHFILIAVILAITMPMATRWFIDAIDEAHEGERPSVFRAWREPRTLVIGLLVLTMAFAEGTGNDWIGVATIDGYSASATMGSLALACFVGAMTAGRWFGSSILERFGRVKTLRTTALIGAAGVLITVFGGNLTIAIIGIVLWGFGCSLGFPVGMSAAADDPVMSAARVSVVATVGYTAFLAGPTLIGFVGEDIGVLRALSVTAGLLAFAFIAAGATRPLPSTTTSVEVPSRD